MKCSEFRENRSKGLVELLDPSTEQASDAHAASCPTCGPEDRTLQKGLAALATSVERAPADFLESTWARIQKEAPAQSETPSSVTRWMDRFAALVTGSGWILAPAMVVLLGVTLWNEQRVLLPAKVSGPLVTVRSSRGDVIAPTAASPGVFALGPGGGRLEIGHGPRTTVVLDRPGSSVDLSKATANVVAGSVRFFVKPQLLAPAYAVLAEGRIIEVTGTKFVVHGGAIARVDLEEGSIRIVAGRDSESSLVLTAGQSASWTESTPPTLIVPTGVQAASPQPSPVATPTEPPPATEIGEAQPRPLLPETAPRPSTNGTIHDPFGDSR